MKRVRIAGLFGVAGLLLVLLWTVVSAQDGSYIVQPGDTLASIAAEHGTTALALAERNGITDPDTIVIGQKLSLPAASADTTDAASPAASPAPVGAVAVAATEAAATPVVAVAMADAPAAETSTAAALPTATTTLTLAAQAPTATAAPASTPASSQVPTTTTYVVQEGDLLREIAVRFDTSAVTLAELNGLASPELIYPGMKLAIPSTVPPDYTGPGSEDATRFIASIARQRCWLYLDNRLAANWRCSTGQKKFPSTPGAYRILDKMDAAYGATWDFWMPYWLGIYYSGSTEDGIHGLPYDPQTGAKTWEGMAGTPVTYGCIMLDDARARQLYEVAYIGMSVVILP